MDTTIGPIQHTPGIECWCKQCELTIFLAARLVNVHGESPNTDYILAAERITGQKIKVDPMPPVSAREMASIASTPLE